MKKFLFLILVFAGIYAEATDQYLSASKNDKWMFSTILGSGSASANYIYSNYLANAAYTMDLPALSTVTDGQSVKFLNESIPSELDSYTKLMIHANGTGQTFTDSASGGKTITANGNATQSATRYKFGGKSAYFDGTGDSLQIADSPDFTLGSGNFCIDFWVYPASTSADGHVLFMQAVDGNYSPILILRNAENIKFYSSSTNSSWNIASDVTIGSVSANTWYHIAIDRYGNNLDYYFNGSKVGTVNVTGITLMDSANPVYIGGGSTSQYFDGYIDEFRYSAGTSRYNSTAFSAETQEYGASFGLIVNPNGSERIFETAAGGNSITLSSQGDFIELMKTPRGWYTVTKQGTITDNL